jgi:hypothetical protein
MEIRKELIDELIATSGGSLIGPDGLVKELPKALVERMLTPKQLGWGQLLSSVSRNNMEDLRRRSWHWPRAAHNSLRRAIESRIARNARTTGREVSFLTI